MKKLLTACLLGISCFAANAAEEPAEFRREFARHQEKGDLFYHLTPKEFEAKGWGEFYRDAVAERFKGAAVDGFQLETSIVPGYRAQVGEKIPLKFRLDNNSEEDVSVTVGGNCKTVHQAGYMAIAPDGQLIQSIGRMMAGGPHCFCQQTEGTLKAGSRVVLDTSTVSDAVVGLAPLVAGKYVIIGIYDLPTKENPERRILSQPLVIEVNDKWARGR